MKGKVTINDRGDPSVCKSNRLHVDMVLGVLHVDSIPLMWKSVLLCLSIWTSLMIECLHVARR